MNNDWSEDIEKILDQIRINCVILSKQHKKRYFYLRSILQYFRLPVIIISGINSIISVGLQPYLNQETISMMTCLLALACSVIGSIELYLAVQKSMENELIASKDYYILSIDLHKTLTLSHDHRPIPAKEYLEKKYSEYVKMFENSNLLAKRTIDSLNPLPAPSLNLIRNHSSKYSPNTNKMSDDESSSASYILPQSPSSFDEEQTLSFISQKYEEPAQKSMLSSPLSLITSLMPQKPSVVEKVSLLTKISPQKIQESSERASQSLLTNIMSQKSQMVTKETALLNKAHETILDKKSEVSNFISQKISEYDAESLLPLNEGEEYIRGSSSPAPPIEMEEESKTNENDE